MESVERASHWYSHVLTGALVPLGVLVEPLIGTWWHESPDNLALWKRLSFYIGLWILAFLFLWVFSEVLESKQRQRAQRIDADRRRQQREFDRKPIELADIGEVDGDWIDAVFENDKLKQGSIITITSTNKVGFRVIGFTYDFDTESEKLAETVHDFTSSDAMMLAQAPGIGYVFSGTETEGTKKVQHDGAGYYEFKWSDRGEKRFTGAFFAEVKKYIRTVEGLYIGKGNTIEHKKQRLHEFLVKVSRARTASAEK
jgi:hypothetical protein